jgi:hypothetical protein
MFTHLGSFSFGIEGLTCEANFRIEPSLACRNPVSPALHERMEAVDKLGCGNRW